MKSYYLIILLALFGNSCVNAQQTTKKSKNMKVAVWDTYVTRKDGKVMHFDIIAPAEIKDASIIHNYGKEYLKTKGQDGQALTAKECRFCHIETLRPSWEKEIEEKGYFILEMENCN